MNARDLVLHRLIGEINRGRTHDLLLPIADRMEEVDESAHLAQPLRQLHAWKWEPYRVRAGGFWYWCWPTLCLPVDAVVRMCVGRQCDWDDGALLMYRRRWNAYLDLAANLCPGRRAK